jgi:hypothetical protein
MMCILAIAAGAGLFAFARHLDPPVDTQNPAMAAIQRNDFEHHAAAVASGVGVGLMTGGVLGLAIPWLNAAMVRRWQPQGQSPAPASAP